MNLLRHTPSFSRPDPLGDGLAEAIAAEQSEPDAFVHDGFLDGEQLASTWQSTLDDLKQDPDWFDFATED